MRARCPRSDPQDARAAALPLLTEVLRASIHEWDRPWQTSVLGDLAMFGIGTQELLIVCIVALLLFGNRLPSVMRSLGSGISEFKKGMNEVQNDLRRSMEEHREDSRSDQQ